MLPGSYLIVVGTNASKEDFPFFLNLSFDFHSFKMILFYVCEIGPGARSEITWNIDVRAFMFNISIDRLEHDEDLVEGTLKEDLKFVEEASCYHFADRFGIFLKYPAYLDPVPEEKMRMINKEVKGKEFKLKVCNLPEVKFISRVVADAFDI